MTVYKPIPVDKNKAQMQEFPAALKAQTRYASENSSASSVLTLTDNTTNLEVTAVNGAAVLRWVPATETAGVSPFGSVISAAATANFDHTIPSGTMRRFAVPIEVTGTASIVGDNIKFGLYRRVAIKSIGVASVLVSEF